MPPPTYSNPITKLEKTIKKLKDLVEEDIEEEEDIRTLKSIIHGMQVKVGKYDQGKGCEDQRGLEAILGYLGGDKRTGGLLDGLKGSSI